MPRAPWVFGVANAVNGTYSGEHTMKLKTLTAFAAFAGIMVSGSANAVTFTTSQVAWDAAMSSTTAIPLPSTASTDSFAAGDLTFTKSGSATNLIVGPNADTWSTLISGLDLAISSPEDVTIDFGTAVTGFSFLLHEPTQSTGQQDGCNTTCFQTTFNFELFDGAISLGDFNFDPLDDVANFIGFISYGAAFDKVVINDVTNTSDNEFFGQFRTGVAAVPIPAPLALFLTGLVGLGIMGRRRKKSAI